VEPKPWYKSRTFWTGVAAVVAGIGLWLETGELATLLTSVTGLVMIILRIVTNQPIDS
jgi:hypothetical protein